MVRLYAPAVHGKHLLSLALASFAVLFDWWGCGNPIWLRAQSATSVHPLQYPYPLMNCDNLATPEKNGTDWDRFNLNRTD
jgi:hypothetical protein